MDNTDTILYACFLIAAMIGILLAFHGIGMICVWWREKWERKDVRMRWFMRRAK